MNTSQTRLGVLITRAPAAAEGVEGQAREAAEAEAAEGMLFLQQLADVAMEAIDAVAKKSRAVQQEAGESSGLFVRLDLRAARTASESLVALAALALAYPDGATVDAFKGHTPSAENGVVVELNEELGWAILDRASSLGATGMPVPALVLLRDDSGPRLRVLIASPLHPIAQAGETLYGSADLEHAAGSERQRAVADAALDLLDSTERSNTQPARSSLFTLIPYLLAAANLSNISTKKDLLEGAGPGGRLHPKEDSALGALLKAKRPPTQVEAANWSVLGSSAASIAHGPQTLKVFM
ncbi:hypothetical protein T492DRAFT_836047 [Pavlovales sp. CCMP2436]|nr:hypothetical protein T492DRAFT_836047 [Pavlovales sp. CCMP2436]